MGRKKRQSSQNPSRRAPPMTLDLHFMHLELQNTELFGYAAAAASLYAANSKTIIPLRFAAIVANTLAICYALYRGTYPTLLLNAILLPLNALRLHAMWKLIH